MSAPRRRLGRALPILSMANLVFVVLIWVAGSLVAERWWPCAIIAYVPQLPFGAPTVVLLAWAAWKRDRLSAGVTALTALLFVLGPMDLKVRQSSAHEGAALRVMTYNIRGGTWRLDHVLATIREARPDVVCLQEAQLHTDLRSRELERRIREGLPGYVGHRCESIMTLARTETVSFDDERLMVGRRSRPIVWATVRSGPREVTIGNVHFVLSSPMGSVRTIGLRRYVEQAVEVRMAQARALRAAARRHREPLILCGDFNTPPRGLVYRMLAAGWTDAFGAVGTGFGCTFASPMPVLRIDYVWLSGDIKPVRTMVPAATGSDHRPVIADVALPRAGNGPPRLQPPADSGPQPVE